MEKVFKVGTKIRIKSYEEIKKLLEEQPKKTWEGTWPGFLKDDMERYCGQAGHIVSLQKNGKCELDIDEKHWNWHVDWLDNLGNVPETVIVKKEKEKRLIAANVYPGGELKIGLQIKDNTTTVFKDGYVGIARCCPSDTFNLETGINLAIGRAEQAKRDAEWPNKGDIFHYVDIDAITGKAVVMDAVWTDPGNSSKGNWKWQYKQNGNFFKTAEEALKVANACNDKITGKKVDE